MGNPIFGKTKNLVLPVPNNYISIKDYKEAYGIDLSEMIEIVGNEVRFNFKEGTSVYFDAHNILTDWFNSNQYGLIPLTSMDDNVQNQGYVSGSTDAMTSYIFFSTFSVRIKVSKDDELSIDNIQIGGLEE